MNQAYTQNWQAYDTAQCNEKTLFIPLLAELCKNVEPKEYGFGRPTLPVSDMLFCAVFKVYSSRSLRRFIGDLKIAKEKGHIDKMPCFASIGHFLQKKGITPILQDLIIKSSLPLRSVEADFAVDSSGFSTCRFKRWFNFKYGKESDFRIWIKAHLICGVKTNIVTSVRLSEATGGDSPYLKTLVGETAVNFNISEVSADKAYSSRGNHELVAEVGGTPFIPFRKNAGKHPWGSPMWKKMYHFFMYNQEEFMKHYHKRSNVETTFHMIKSKFGDSLKSKTKAAQVNEVLCKILCHNLCVLIQEMHELRTAKQYQI
jgi:transposase